MINMLRWDNDCRDVSEFWPKSLKMLLSVKSEGILHHKCIRVIKIFWKYSWTKLHLISILLGNHQHLISSIKVTTVWLQSTGILKFPETGRYDRNVLLLHSGCIECLKSFLDKKKKATNEVKIIKKIVMKCHLVTKSICISLIQVDSSSSWMKMV